MKKRACYTSYRTLHASSLKNNAYTSFAEVYWFLNTFMHADFSFSMTRIIFFKESMALAMIRQQIRLFQKHPRALLFFTYLRFTSLEYFHSISTALLLLTKMKDRP